MAMGDQWPSTLSHGVGEDRAEEFMPSLTQEDFVQWSDESKQALCPPLSNWKDGEVWEAAQLRDQTAVVHCFFGTSWSSA